jgi:hypothetical protein
MKTIIHFAIATALVLVVAVPAFSFVLQTVERVGRLLAGQ